MDILIPIITGIFGLVAGLLIPFVKWKVEKMKIRHNERIVFISQLREFILSEEFSTDKFKDTYLYSRFRKHLPVGISERIDCKDGTIHLELVVAGSRDGLQNELLDQITILEEKWNLI